MTGASIDSNGGTLNYTTSWIGNTWGGANNRYVQIDVQGIAVTPDGTVYTNAPWDEAGGEIGVYQGSSEGGKNKKNLRSSSLGGYLLSYAGATHGWGNSGGDAVAVNHRYLYAAASIGNEKGHLVGRGDYPPEGSTWFGVTRRDRTDIRSGAPFADGVGNLNGPAKRSFLVLNTVPADSDGGVRGLAANEARLYVANTWRNRIEVFDAQTMRALWQWPAQQPGKLALAPDGTLWAIIDIFAAAPQLARYTPSGQPLSAEVPLPVDAKPTDIAFDAAGRLLIADDSARQQVLIFAPNTSTAPTVSTKNPAPNSDSMARWRPAGALGVAGGIFAGSGAQIGVPGPQRFNGLVGVGADQSGNIIVAMNGNGPRRPGIAGSAGAVIESYAPDQHRNWSVQGLLFVDSIDIDRADPVNAFSGTKRFAIDFKARGPGQEWSYAGFTANRFKYPEDPAFHGARIERGMPLVRHINGRRFVFFTDMYADFLKVYRFDRRRDGEVAIPSGLFAREHIKGNGTDGKPANHPASPAWPPHQPAAGAWIWRDANGNGRFDANEYAVNPLASQNLPRGWAWWVDTRGDVWQGGAPDGIRRFAVQGLDRAGNPIYDFAHMQTYPLPPPFTRIDRIQYLPADDTLYVSGETAARPYDERNWKGAGYVFARYDHWNRRVQRAASVSPRYLIDLPRFEPRNGHSIASLIVEGDYLFAAEMFTGIVHVYDARNGSKCGEMRPGPEVGGLSGWIDVPMGISAYYRHQSGEYWVFVEEDWRGKVIIYRFTPAASG